MVLVSKNCYSLRDLDVIKAVGSDGVSLEELLFRTLSPTLSSGVI